MTETLNCCEECGSTQNVNDYWWIEAKNEKWKLCKTCGIEHEQERCDGVRECEDGIDRIVIDLSSPTIPKSTLVKLGILTEDDTRYYMKGFCVRKNRVVESE